MKEKKNTLLGTLATLKVGGSKCFPISKLNSVRTACSSFGLQWGKRFTTNVVREEKVVKVTRVQ